MVIIWAKIWLGNAKKKKGVSPACPIENSVMADSKHKWLLKLSRISKLSARLPVNTVSIQRKSANGKNRFLRNCLNSLRMDVQERLPITTS